MSEVNSVGFTPEEVKKGLHLDLINYLLDYNKKSEHHFNEIHITSDGYCLIVEWVNNNYEYMAYNGFKYVDEDHRIFKRVEFPDNHSEYLDDDEENEAIEEWIKDNPGWEKDRYGMWHNKKEHEFAENYFEKLRGNSIEKK